MNQPTDLRELLREARETAKDCSFIIAAWLSNPKERPDLEPSARVALKKWLELEPKLSDAALTQPPDAKPIGYVIRMTGNYHTGGFCGEFFCEKILSPQTKLYAAPQPPSGKGEPAAWTATPIEWAEHQSETVRKLTRNSQPQYGFDIPLYAEPIDAIPREIHERLVRDAKREELREVAEQMHMIGFYGLAQWLRSRASEHERDGR
jgi:hypothetical protein